MGCLALDLKCWKIQESFTAEHLMLLLRPSHLSKSLRSQFGIIVVRGGHLFWRWNDEGLFRCGEIIEVVTSSGVGRDTPQIFTFESSSKPGLENVFLYEQLGQ